MKRYSKNVIKTLASLGFDHIWTNADGYPCYVHPDDPDQTELSISPSISNEATARNLVRRAQKIARVAPVVEKRKAGQVKERQQAERDRARQRLEYVRAKQHRLIEQDADAAERARVEALIEVRERELAEYERLMKQPAQGGNTHRGTGHARHYVGARP
ncbi:hypothetical protein ACFZAR_36040 [Streptomyces sp. NPDC008222]|uniref:hypothetical protein n=1 Tax=Streptomyces sp. NPDC008222 TaxID=3364820 RepID=UPI0036EA88FB